jgi:outer membrane immunogenic protein
MRAYLVAITSVLALAAAASPAAAQGLRAEVHGGWDRVQGDNQEEDGIVYGVGLGYDALVGQSAFVGVDLSLDDSSTKECERGVLVANDTACLNAGRDLAAAVRAGVLVGERSKVYALAGYTNARYRFSYTTPAGVTTRESENLDGFRLGAGYEHGFGANTYGKLEYRYSNYEADVSRHQVLVGFGVNF